MVEDSSARLQAGIEGGSHMIRVGLAEAISGEARSVKSFEHISITRGSCGDNSDSFPLPGRILEKRSPTSELELL